jgi:hypothetical protein
VGKDKTVPYGTDSRLDAFQAIRGRGMPGYDHSAPTGQKARSSHWDKPTLPYGTKNAPAMLPAHSSAKNRFRGLRLLPIPPFTPTVVPTAVAPLAPTIAPVSPAVVPIAPSSQLYAVLIGRGLGLLDDRRAYAGDSLRNSRLRRIGGIHFGGSSVW